MSHEPATEAEGLLAQAVEASDPGLIARLRRQAAAIEEEDLVRRAEGAVAELDATLPRIRGRALRQMTERLARVFGRALARLEAGGRQAARDILSAARAEVGR
jgi:hypothetical protein